MQTPGEFNETSRTEQSEPNNYQQNPYPPQQQQYPPYGQQPVYGQPVIVVPYSQQPQYGQPIMYQGPDMMAGMVAPPRNLPYHANGLGYPAEIICPKCKKKGVTEINREIGAGTYTMSYLIFLICPICCFVPCCVQDCQDVVHQCPHCKEEVGLKPYTIC